MAELCRCVGAAAWACALAVLLVDVHTVGAFRALSPLAWEQFVHLTLSDPSYAFLHEVLSVLSGDGDASVQARALGGPGQLSSSLTHGSAGRPNGVPPYMQAISEGGGDGGTGTSGNNAHAANSSQGFLQGLVNGDIDDGMQQAVGAFATGQASGGAEAQHVALAESLASAMERLHVGVPVDVMQSRAEGSESGRSSQSQT